MSWLKRAIRHVPILNGLADARLSDHREAVSETGTNIVLSTIPVWLGAILMLADKTRDLPLFELIITNVRSGELFLYATAALGPLYYFLLKEYQGLRIFPSRRLFILVATVIMLISVGLFAIQRAGDLFGASDFVDSEFIFALSWKVYFASLALIYLAHVYKNLLESGAASVSSDQTREFAKKFANRGK